MMTALELATAIACEARRAKTTGHGAVKVLQVLDENRTWFCRIVEQRDGLTRDVPLPHPKPGKPRKKVR